MRRMAVGYLTAVIFVGGVVVSVVALFIYRALLAARAAADPEDTYAVYGASIVATLNSC